MPCACHQSGIASCSPILGDDANVAEGAANALDSLLYYPAEAAAMARPAAIAEALTAALRRHGQSCQVQFEVCLALHQLCHHRRNRPELRAELRRDRHGGCSGAGAAGPGGERLVPRASWLKPSLGMDWLVGTRGCGLCGLKTMRVYIYVWYTMIYCWIECIAVGSNIFVWHMSRYAVNQVFLFTILFINFWVRPDGHCLSTTQWDIWFGIRGHLALFCHVIWHYLGTMLWENGCPSCTCSSRAPISLGGAELRLMRNLVHTYGPLQLPAPKCVMFHSRPCDSMTRPSTQLQLYFGWSFRNDPHAFVQKILHLNLLLQIWCSFG